MLIAIHFSSLSTIILGKCFIQPNSKSPSATMTSVTANAFVFLFCILLSGKLPKKHCGQYPWNMAENTSSRPLTTFLPSLNLSADFLLFWGAGNEKLIKWNEKYSSTVVPPHLPQYLFPSYQRLKRWAVAPTKKAHSGRTGGFCARPPYYLEQMERI